MREFYTFESRPVGVPSENTPPEHTFGSISRQEHVTKGVPEIAPSGLSGSISPHGIPVTERLCRNLTLQWLGYVFIEEIPSRSRVIPRNITSVQRLLDFGFVLKQSTFIRPIAY